MTSASSKASLNARCSGNSQAARCRKPKRGNRPKINQVPILPAGFLANRFDTTASHRVSPRSLHPSPTPHTAAQAQDLRRGSNTQARPLTHAGYQPPQDNTTHHANPLCQISKTLISRQVDPTLVRRSQSVQRFPAGTPSHTVVLSPQRGVCVSEALFVRSCCLSFTHHVLVPASKRLA